MASITNRPNGTKEIQFKYEGKRRTLRLGKRVSKREAERYKHLIELAMLSERIDAPEIEAKICEYLSTLSGVVLDKLDAMGVISLKGRRIPATLGELVDQYVASRNDVKPATKEVWRQGKLGLIEHFGASARIAKITEGQAEQYKVDLLSKIVGRSSDGTDRTMAEATVKKRLDFARQVFRYALKHDRISKNPFANVKASGSASANHAEVTREMFDLLLPECPNRDWRLILTLCRFGGMRCPSEVLSLRWGDIHWDRDTMVVTSPKTEHHQGHDSRITPLFPELRQELDAAYSLAEGGSLYVVNEKLRKSAQGPAGWRNVNLRTQFEKIIWRAGLKPWPYLFHSMRSSRATELLDAFPIHVVAQWMGMSVAILARHYAKVRDRHVQKATQNDVRLLARATQPDASDSASGAFAPINKGSKGLTSGLKSDAR